MDIMTLLSQIVQENAATLSAAVIPIIVNEIIRFLPIKPNSIMEGLAIIMVKIGNAIIARAGRVDDAVKG